ncbi:MAG TPA: hypothetical protein VMU89_20200 [Thermomicrobiaceae bacterium]|nr:hypothetical protein [Thermomicrobiaceae bacterium]
MYGMILHGMVATRLLDERRAEAARDRLSAGVANDVKRDLRGAAGRLLVRAGGRLAGTSSVRRIPAQVA